LLADAEELGAQIVLHLGAVEGVLNQQRRDDVFPVEQAVLALDIVELDGEAVGGGGQLALAEEEGGRAALLAPPAKDGLSGGEFAGGDFAEDAEDVDVGEVGVVVAGGGRTIEDDGDEALAVGLLEFPDELRE